MPQRLLQALGSSAGVQVLVGPHASTTPRAALHKTGGDIAVLGACEEMLVHLGSHLARLQEVSGIAYLHEGRLVIQGGSRMVNLASLPALRWPLRFLDTHRHHRHRFDEPQ